MKTRGVLILWIILGLSSVLPFLLSPEYAGNAYRHFVMEMVASWLAFSTAILLFNCSLDRNEVLTPYLVTAFSAAGLTDLLHGLFAMGILLTPEAQMSEFIPGTWTASRTVLGAVMVYGLLQSTRRPEYHPPILTLTLTTAGLVVTTSLIFATLPIPRFILQEIPFFSRPWEFLALGLYLWAIKLIWQGHKRHSGVIGPILLPCLYLGAITQALMAFSDALFNPAFDASHVLKAVSYAAALVASGILIVQKSKTSVRVASSQILSISMIFTIALAVASLLSLALVRNMETVLERDRGEQRFTQEIHYRVLLMTDSIHNYLIAADPRASEEFNQYWASMEEGEFFSSIKVLETEHAVPLSSSLQNLQDIAEEIFALSDPIGSAEGQALNNALDQTIAELGSLFEGILIVESVQLDQSEQEVNTRISTLILGVVGLMLLILPLFYVVSARRVSTQLRPVLDMTTTAQLIGEGESHLRFDIQSQNEVGILGQTFNLMLDRTEESETRYRDLFEGTSDLIQSVGSDGRFRYVNQAWKKTMGYSQDEVDALSMWDIVAPGSQEHCATVFKEIMAGKDVNLMEVDFLTKDGQVIHLEGSARCSFQEGQLHETRAIFHDITQRLEATVKLRDSVQALEDANLQLHQVNTHKSRFLSSMSHELRTPLNAVIGFSDLLNQQSFGPLNEKQFQYAQQISQSGHHLLTLINDLLDMAKIDAGAMEINREIFSIGECIESMVAMMGSQFNKKQLTVKTSIDSSLPEMHGDSRKCKQILLNLLSNAMKFTQEKGQITIEAKQDGEDWIRISVSDTGLGIAPGQLENVFSEFHQVDRARDEALGGIGLGLALTRRLVELHGGEIGVESEVGRGSTFWFTLPAWVPKKGSLTGREKNTEDIAPYPSERRILVAEDDQVNLKVLLEMLSIHDHQVAVAQNGQEAVELAQSVHPELILMDVRMPVMGGLEATRRLREMPEFSDTPIIAFTASVGPEAQKKCLEAGCTSLLSKPVTTEQLFQALATHLPVKKEG